MHALTSVVENAILKAKNQDKICGTAIYPINQDGRQVTCFCDMNVNNAELYDYNVLKKGGNYFLINCWHSRLYCHPHHHLRTIVPPGNAIYKCKECDFCLCDSAGYNLYIMTDKKDIDQHIAVMLDEIEKELNAPICNVIMDINGVKKTLHLNDPIYERSEKPCVKPKEMRGIFRKSRNKKEKAKLPKGRL